ncbi:hypothetical protein ABZ671_25020 [Micromonospora sp. NPDC006766]|uniref:hypothetical protein n=1 Tax=Micromonospora sp. NPDC006766 TaxID=3154778 RepID=UPI0033E81A11
MSAIVAALLVLLPTVGLVAMQMLSPFSWRAARVVFSGSSAMSAAVVAVLGVALPMVAAVNPSPLLTRLAFAGFGMALLLMADATWRGSRRANPGWFVSHTARKVSALADRASRPRRALEAQTELLTELVGAARLPIEQYRTTAATWALALVLRWHAGVPPEDIARVIRLVVAELGREPAAGREDVITALAALGVHLSGDRVVAEAVIESIGGLAQRARTSGPYVHSDLLLDALVDVVGARLAQLLPPRTLRVLRPPSPDVGRRRRRAPDELDGRPTRAAEDRLQLLGERSSVENGTAVGLRLGHGPSNEIGPEQRRQRLVSRSVREAVDDATRHALDAEELMMIFDSLCDSKQSTAPATTLSTANMRARSAQAYDLFLAEVNRLASMLAAPTPESAAWPAGWQGSAGFQADVRRLGHLASRLYSTHRMPPDAVEEQLEAIATRLSGDVGPARPLPPDRTGWRTTHTPNPTGPAVAAAETMAELAAAAFHAGFDRRALLTGRRLLSAATMAATAGDGRAVEIYTQALDRVAQQLRWGHGNDMDANRHRSNLVLAGLIAEFDPLLSATPPDQQADKAINELVDWLPWQTNGNPYPLAAAAWQARLTAAGWLAHSPGKRRRQPVPAGQPQALPHALVTKAEEEFQLHLHVDDPIYPAVYLLTLWAHAIAAVREGDRDAAYHLHEYLNRVIDEYGKDDQDDDAHGQPATAQGNHEGKDEHDSHARQIHPQLRRLITAATNWSANARTGRREVVLSRRRVPGLHNSLRELLAGPGFSDRRYHGLPEIDGSYLVVVEEPDGSRRLLRDSEAGARGLFAWGYGGTGPHTLADVLTDDILAELNRCPDCFGATKCAAGLIRCRTCRNTGLRMERWHIASALVSRVISSLPNHPAAAPTIPEAEWSLTRSALLTEACRTQTAGRNVPRVEASGS